MKRSNEYFTASVIGSVILAVIVWLVIIFFDRNLLIIFGAQDNTLALAREYVLPIKFAIPFFLFNQMLSHFFTKKNTLRLVKPQNLLHKLKQITATGFSTFFIDVAMGILTILFNRQIMACLGTNALSVYGVIVNISTFVQCCAYSVGQASQPIISTNFGAGKGDRIRETLFLCKTQRISKYPRTSTRSKNVLLRV